MAITTVIFDWGGVLIADPAPLLRDVFARELGVSGEAIVAAADRYIEPFQKGICSEREFWRSMCADLGVREPGAGSLWGDAFREVYSPKKQVWKLARSLKQRGYKTGLLSNTEIPAVEFFEKNQDHVFDQLIFSCRERCRKPEPRIYQIAMERMGSRADEAVFIDDNPKYVEGAKAVGLHGIGFVDADSLVRDLSSLGVLS